MPVKSVRLLLLVTLVVAGCGHDGPALGTVQGKVTLDGVPLINAEISFNPQGVKNGTGSYGRTDGTGHYELMFTRTRAGAMIGHHNIGILVERPSPAQIEELKQAGLPVPGNVTIPKKYQKPGELTADVQRGANTIDFSLTSK